MASRRNTIVTSTMMNDQQEQEQEVLCCWSDFKAQMAKQGACTNSAVYQLWIEARVQEMRRSKDIGGEPKCTVVDRKNIAEVVLHTRLETSTKEHRRQLSGSKQEQKPLRQPRRKLMRGASWNDDTPEHQHVMESKLSMIDNDKKSAKTNPESKSCGDRVVQPKNGNSLFNMSRRQQERARSKETSKKKGEENTCSSRVVQPAGISFFDMGRRHRCTKSMNADFLDKDLRETLKATFEKESNTFKYKAMQWQGRRASTGGIPLGSIHSLTSTVEDSSATVQQRKERSLSTQTAHGVRADINRKLGSLVFPGNKRRKGSIEFSNSKSEDMAVQEEQRQKQVLPQLAAHSEAKPAANAKITKKPSRDAGGTTNLKGKRRHIVKKAMSSLSAASYHSPIDRELPPDDKSVSSLDEEQSRSCLSVLGVSSDDPSNSNTSIDEQSLSLREDSKGKLHFPDSATRSMASSVCSDIQSECDEEDFGCSSSSLFRPYVVGSGNGCMDMSALSLDHDYEPDAVVQPEDRGLPNKASRRHQLMRRACRSAD
jgi:hypothetical protein